MQPILDELYARSKANALKGVDLYKIITSKENILLAYRSIKSNTGSKTKGTDNLTIDDYKIIDEVSFINGIRATLANYHPRMVRRVYIDKEYGNGQRPLGIPTMRDRLIQQMFKQVLEPIVEAKFHKHSYGFRPNRSTHDAMARCYTHIHASKLHFIVDVDIQGFFDNVCHRKLIKQLHSIGIKDKRVLVIINKMLKAEIENEGVSTKGTPQGGILSPLLSNVVLNQFDWWVSNQWETFETRRKYRGYDYRLLKQHESNLKKMYIVRYADDFKVFTDSYVNANKVYHAIKMYLKENLFLDISPEKSKITNLRKKSSDFLGFSIRANKKKMKRADYVTKTNIMKKKKQKIYRDGKEYIKRIQKSPTPQSVKRYNAWVLGVQNYFRIATHVTEDLPEIAYRLNRVMYNRLKSIGKYGIPKEPSATYEKFYGNYKCKTWTVAKINLFPLGAVKKKNPMNYSQDICNYTVVGREKIFKKMDSLVETELQKLMNSHIPNRSIEYFDNRISRYSMQKGKCGITGKFLFAFEVHCHHIKAVKDGGDDSFRNLIIIHKDLHVLIHATNETVISQYITGLKKRSIDKINKLRKSLMLEPIE